MLGASRLFHHFKPLEWSHRPSHYYQHLQSKWEKTADQFTGQTGGQSITDTAPLVCTVMCREQKIGQVPTFEYSWSIGCGLGTPTLHIKQTWNLVWLRLQNQDLGCQVWAWGLSCLLKHSRFLCQLAILLERLWKVAASEKGSLPGFLQYLSRVLMWNSHKILQQ